MIVGLSLVGYVGRPLLRLPQLAFAVTTELFLSNPSAATRMKNTRSLLRTSAAQCSTKRNALGYMMWLVPQASFGDS
eukprot:4302034-Amphidinium_carterae.1